MDKKEMVDHPQHYNFNGYECLDVMVAVFGREKVMDFCKINSFKYLWRSEQKNGAEDLKKARWYMNYWYQLCEDEPLMNEETVAYVEADCAATEEAFRRYEYKLINHFMEKNNIEIYDEFRCGDSKDLWRVISSLDNDVDKYIIQVARCAIWSNKVYKPWTDITSGSIESTLTTFNELKIMIKFKANKKEEVKKEEVKKEEVKKEEDIMRPIESLNRSEDVFDTVVVDDAEQSWLNIMQENEIDYEEEFHFEEATYDFEGMTTVYKFSVEGPDVHHLNTYLQQTSMQRGVRNEFVRSELRPDQFYDLCKKSCMTFITGKFITHDIEKETAVYNKKKSTKNEVLNDPFKSFLEDFDIEIDDEFSASEDSYKYRIHWTLTDTHSLEVSFRDSNWQKYKGNISGALAQFREDGIMVEGVMKYEKK